MDLSGIRVLVTRPEPFSTALALAIGELNGQAISLPMIQIKPLATGKGAGMDLAQSDIIIFTSRFAAQYGVELVKTYARNNEVMIYTVGKGTAETLEQKALTAYCQNDPGSEALLDMESLKRVRDKNIVILKGKDGRNHMREVLENRGAQVKTLDLYVRKSLFYKKNTINSIILDKKINAIVATSIQIIETLADQLERSLLKNIPVIVPGERIARVATRSLGLKKVLCANGADNKAILKTLCKLKSSTQT